MFDKIKHRDVLVMSLHDYPASKCDIKWPAAQGESRRTKTAHAHAEPGLMRLSSSLQTLLEDAKRTGNGNK